MSLIKVLIIDDETAGIFAIEHLLSTYTDKVVLVGSARNIEEAWEIINKSRPDLIFLDLKMPRGSGLDLLERYPKRKFEVVFVSASEPDYKAISRYQALRHICKPIVNEDIEHILQLYRQKKGES